MSTNDYPAMLYRDGKLSAAGEQPTDYVIVGDAGEEAHAVTQGYARAGDAPKKKGAK